MTSPHRQHQHPHLYARLHCEWGRLAHARSALAAARSWRLEGEPNFESLDDLLRLAGYGTIGDPTGGDDVLRQLISIAQSDALAARVVLQRLLPGLIGVGRRRGIADSTGSGAVRNSDDLLATAWTVIRTYPIAHRPNYVAAGLLREIDYVAYRLPYRRLARFVPTPATTFEQRTAANISAGRNPFNDSSNADSSCVDSIDTNPVGVNSLVTDSFAADSFNDTSLTLQQVFAHARRTGIDGTQIDLLQRLADGASTADLAGERHVTARTIRNHRDATVRAIRELAVADG